MTIFATSNPSQRTDMAALVRAYQDWQPLRGGAAGQPIVILGASGLRVGVRHPVSNAAGLEALIDYGIGLSRLLSRP